MFFVVALKVFVHFFPICFPWQVDFNQFADRCPPTVNFKQKTTTNSPIKQESAKMHRDPVPLPLTPQSASTWTNNNPCANHALELYMCTEKKGNVEKCKQFTEEYRKCLQLSNYMKEKWSERFENSVRSYNTSGFSVNSWR